MYLCPIIHKKNKNDMIAINDKFNLYLFPQPAELTKKPAPHGNVEVYYGDQHIANCKERDGKLIAQYDYELKMQEIEYACTPKQEGVFAWVAQTGYSRDYYYSVFVRNGKFLFPKRTADALNSGKGHPVYFPDMAHNVLNSQYCESEYGEVSREVAEKFFLNIDKGEHFKMQGFLEREYELNARNQSRPKDFSIPMAQWFGSVLHCKFENYQKS